MGKPPVDSTLSEDRDVLFQSAYGCIPKVVLYGLIPFLLVVSGVFFVRAVWFGEGMAIRGIRLSPETVAYWICPAIWLLCAFLHLLDIYRHIHPQCIVVTEDEVLLPKGRFTSEIIQIRWNDLSATIFAGRIAFLEIYEITCLDDLHGTKSRIASNLFRDFDDFATFALIVGEHMGKDWSIKGFLPGAMRGNQEQARLAIDRIQAREDN